MIRSLRAFMWLRWRLLVNTIRSGERRDVLERVSRTLAAIAPFIVGALSIGSFVGAAVLGFVGGRAAAGGLISPFYAMFVVRLVLAVLTFFVILMTLLSPTQTTMTSYTRLLLLPISRETLHVVELAASLTDPWIAILIPGLGAFAVGLAVGGRGGLAAVVAIAGVVMLFVLLSLASLVSFLIAWLVRSRRRGELFTLVFTLAISTMSVLPAMISIRNQPDRQVTRTTRTRTPFSVERFDASLPRWSRGVPSELYGVAVRSAAEDRSGVSALAIGLLALEGLVLFVASSAVHARLIGSLETEQQRHRVGGAFGGLRVPFVSPEVGAVALAQVRMVLRSVRGRLAVLLPGPLVISLMMITTAMFRRAADAPPGFASALSHGDLVFAFGALLSLHALQPFTMNLFGTDRAGLTMLFLSPLSDRDIARGKIVGCGLVLLISMAIALLGALIIAPGGAVWSWLAVPIGILAIYTLLAPIAVSMSGLFPVAADLSRMGNRGNPHPVAVLAGTFAVMAAAIPPAICLIAVDLWWRPPALVLLMMSVWFGLTALIGLPLLNVAARAIGPRRENLALLTK